MAQTQFLAQLIGAFSIIMGLSMLARRKMLTSIFHELSQNRALSYILGVLIFLIGLLLVLSHNIWQGLLQTIITLLGWGVVLEGVFFLFVSEQTLKKYLVMPNRKEVYYLIAAVYLALGLYLSYSGFTL